jgi:HK97 family phage prohead protease
MTMKTKDFALKLKATDGAPGEIEGYASVFNVRDSYNEVVVPGAFADSLARHQREGSYPLMLWQHDTYEPIGVWDELSDDGKGLYAKGRLLIEQSVPEADKAYALLKAGALRGMSIGYREVDVEPPDNGGPRKLVKLDLLECSIVSFPANRRAGIEAVKSEADVLAISYWKRFEDWGRRISDGEVPPPSDFEDLLRDARVSKSQRARIASRLHAVLRSESGEGEEANTAIEALKRAATAFRSAAA